jgi:hypothetical protein
MSNFLCDKCNRPNIDSPTGYVAGCQHYPPNHERYVIVSFGGDTPEARAFYSGSWYKSIKAKVLHRAIHPVAWRAEAVDKTTQFSPQDGIGK